MDAIACDLNEPIKLTNHPSSYYRNQLFSARKKDLLPILMSFAKDKGLGENMSDEEREQWKELMERIY